ncbi:hypothetical protein Poli38472_000271 [Pythium oligandrum]|uniref:WD repeat protein mio zinc-ribbon like domain-containing protein n=1 Tax=Pythium oligandrum TaxID=41045 RepID=A0A8K1CBZ2_PYTOL|nr:hypothetical protein Poli38472_000271 [Pythium oligandrum]|eukprot:TMW60229.1 hypothetical protein Poli38472_000271 [Pythium oligandrum]
MNKQRMLVEWSPHDASLFAVGSDNLRLFESLATDVDVPIPTHQPTTQRKRSFRLVKMNAQVTQLKCMEWYPFEAKPLWITAGLGSGKVVLSDFQDARTRVVREFVPKYSRPCNAVAWNTAVPHQLAAGFEKVRSDCCTLVWDVNTGSSGSTISGAPGSNGTNGNGPMSGIASGLSGTMVGTHLDAHTLEDVDGGRKPGVGVGTGLGGNNGVGAINGTGLGGPSSSVGVPSRGGSRANGGISDKPIHELSNSEATVALSWVPLQPTCLAVGTGFKWLRVYDLRGSGASTPLSVVAHNKAVLGVVFDQHRPHILATYTDAPQEAVKVWDIRRLDSNVGPLVSLHPPSKTLAQVSWCPTKPGILVTASTEERWVSLWDVTNQEATGPGGTIQLKKPFRRRYTSDPLTSFSWQNVEPISSSQAKKNRENRSGIVANTRLAAAAFPNRLLTASVTGEIEDISVHDSIPISVSPHGAMTFSCGRLLFGGSTTEDSGNLLPQSTPQEEDISTEMRRLAKTGYSMTVAKNLKLFTNIHPNNRQLQLRTLWQWVDQAESLRRVQVSRFAQAKSSIASNGNLAVGGVHAALAAGPLRGWPVDPNTLTLVGVKTLLYLSEEAAPDSTVPTPAISSMLRTDPTLACPCYEGFGRRLALLACNWDPDCGQNTTPGVIGAEAPPRQHGLSLHRSNSGAWTSQRQYEDGVLNAGGAFGNRSWNEMNRHELRNLLAKCESEGNHARAAALAVFHGDLSAAVSILQKGAMWLSQVHNLNVAITAPYSSDVLQLVAMAVAGYSTAVASTGGQSLWSNMCQQLLRREEITAHHHPRYLHALLSFLCAASSSPSSASATGGVPRPNIPPQPARRGNTRRSWGSVDGLANLSNAAKFGGLYGSSGVYSAILNDSTLLLSDRLAFASRFLPQDELRTFVAQCEEECEQQGRVDGLLITGCTADGIRLLQQYLDKTGDIQTLALLAARLPAAHVAQSTSLSRWITIYQDLLNQWQLFHERARFDVGRSQLEDVLNSFASFARDPDAQDLPAELASPASLTVPPQLYVRCNYCNNSLSLAHLLRLGGSHSSWLNRAKPKLTCCPSCRKPLPQCALCLLPLGALNPYLELAHRRSKQTAETVSAIVSIAGSGGDASGTLLDDPSSSKLENESLAQLSSIPFVEWFTWCQSCKHGGHAHHIADWFATHRVCPVTDCSCQCQHMDLPIALQQQKEENNRHEENDVERLQQFVMPNIVPQMSPGVPNPTSTTTGSIGFPPPRQDLSRRGSRVTASPMTGFLTPQGTQYPSRMVHSATRMGAPASMGMTAPGTPGGVLVYGDNRSNSAVTTTPPTPGMVGGEVHDSIGRLTLSNKLDQLEQESGTYMFI